MNERAVIKSSSMKVVGVILGFGAVLSLGGCSAIGNALGFSKRPPDEFEVVSKSPLVIPPDYNLRPPGEEDVALKEMNPKDMAYRALFPTRAQANTPMPAVPTDGVGTAPLAPPADSGLMDGFTEGVSGSRPDVSN